MIKGFGSSLVCGGILVTLATSQTFAQNDQFQPQNQQPWQSNQEQNQRFNSSNLLPQVSENSQPQTLQGTIDSVRQAQWFFPNGSREPRALVRIRLESGESVVVDLGNSTTLATDLNQGDQIQLRGHLQTIDGQPVFMANRLRLNGESFAVQRNRSSSDFENNSPSQFANSNSNSSSRRERTVRGLIEGFREIYLRSREGEGIEHGLVKLRSDNGRSIVADLGPKENLTELSLEKGDPITLQGRRGTIDGQNVFFADRIRSGDKALTISRFDFAQAGQFARQEEQEGQNKGSERQQQFTLHGKVAGYQVLDLESGQRQVSLLNLRLQDGRSVLIDAGTSTGKLDLKDLDVHDRVTIKGHVKDVDGQQVLVADNVQFTTPEHSEGAAGQPGEQQESSGQGSSSSNQEHHHQSQQEQNEQP